MGNERVGAGSNRSWRAILALGLILTFVSVVSLTSLRRGSITHQLELQGEAFVNEVDEILAGAGVSAQTVAALFGASLSVTAQDFEDYAGTIGTSRGIQALGYVSLDGSVDLRHIYPQARNPLPVIDPTSVAAGLDGNAGPEVVDYLAHDMTAIMAGPVRGDDGGVVGVSYAVVDLSPVVSSKAGFDHALTWLGNRASNGDGPDVGRFSQVVELGGSYWLFEVTGEQPAGIDMALLLVAVFGVGGSFLAASRTTLRDEKIATEFALENLRRSTADKDRFMASVSHELRTPLTSVVGLSSILESSWRSMEPDDVQRMISDIHHEGRELADLVEDLLTIGRVESDVLTYRPHDISLEDEIDRVVERIIVPHHVSIVRPERLGGAFADPLRTRQIVRNLLANATRHAESVIVIRPVTGAGFVGVEIANDGPGIPADQASRLFQAYQAGLRAGQPGSIGLGLYVSRQLARGMGGELAHVSSSETVAFRLTLPGSQAVLEAHAVASADSA